MECKLWTSEVFPILVLIQLKVFMKIFLTDNGSLRAASVFSLRSLAEEVTRLSGEEVTPACLLHSDRIPASELAGQPAPILETCIQQALEAGQRELAVVPLFFGPSRAITEYLPALARRAEKRWGGFSLKVARPLVDLADPSTVRAVGTILVEAMDAVWISARFKVPPYVILVDHGTPEPAVNAVREALVSELGKMLGARVREVTGASMERRPGTEYAFNEPLLETALSRPELVGIPVVVSFLFLQPGRHAGPGGDIEQIIRRAQDLNPKLRVYTTPLVAECNGLAPLLAQRVQEVIHSC